MGKHFPNKLLVFAHYCVATSRNSPKFVTWSVTHAPMDMSSAKWFALAAVLAFTLPIPLLADSFTYTYTGNDFTSVSGAYTTSDSVSGSFTVSSPLQSDLTSLTVIDPTAFTFTDGVNTISNNSGPDLADEFQVETDANGNPTGWNIFVQDGLGGFSGQNYIQIISGGEDYGEDNEHEYSYNVPEEGSYQVEYSYSCGFFGTCYGYYTQYYTYYVTEYGYENDGLGYTSTPGSFSPDFTPAPATPEPASFILTGTALVALAGLTRKRQGMKSGRDSLF